jgi:hypothetical protein
LAEPAVVQEVIALGAAAESGLQSDDSIVAWSAGTPSAGRTDLDGVWDVLTLQSQRSGYASIVLHVRRAGGCARRFTARRALGLRGRAGARRARCRVERDACQ